MIKAHLYRLLLITIILLSSPTFATSSSENISLLKLVDQAYPAANPKAHTGIIIQSAKTGKILFQRNSEQLFIPASIQKLFVATASLLYLHPDFTYSTTITSLVKPSHHVLNGDIYIHFSGDPYFSSKDLDELFHTLKKQGVDVITGNIYLDTSAFDDVYYPPGWLWDDLSYSFAAQLSAANINQNKFLLHLTTDKPSQTKPILSVNLPTSLVKLSNNARITQGYYKNCPLTIHSDTNNNYIIAGCIAKNHKTQRRSLAIRDPKPYVKLEVKQAAVAQGIKYNAIEFKAATGNQQHLLANHDSATLSDIVKHMLTQSDNLAADALLKTIGHVYYEKPGTWQNGIHAMQHIFKGSANIDLSSSIITDGAGLSRYNLMSPQQFSQLLYFIQQQNQLSSDLKAALPKPGEAGTLAYRMKSYRQSKRIAAKTGSMSGVSSLAGFINTPNNGKLIFVIVSNGFVGPAKRFHHYEDRLCQLLITSSFSASTDIKST